MEIETRHVPPSLSGYTHPMTDTKGNILWVDDEVDLFRPHILFLEQNTLSIPSPMAKTR